MLYALAVKLSFMLNFCEAMMFCDCFSRKSLYPNACIECLIQRGNSMSWTDWTLLGCIHSRFFAVPIWRQHLQCNCRLQRHLPLHRFNRSIPNHLHLQGINQRRQPAKTHRGCCIFCLGTVRYGSESKFVPVACLISSSGS